MKSLEMKEEARIKAQKINKAGFKIKDKEEVKAQEAKVKTYEAKQKTPEIEKIEEQELLFTSKKDIKLLSKRQLECLSLCAHGYSNSSISKVLYISESTVKKTMEETFKKLHTTCRTSAVTLAFVFGILNTDILNKTATQYHIKMKNRDWWE